MRIVYLLALLLLAWTSSAQNLTGTVTTTNEKGKQEPVPGASLFWAGTQIHTSSDSTGNFDIPLPDSLPATLITIMTGFSRDTILVTSPQFKAAIKLQQSVQLKEVSVETRQKSTTYSIFRPINTEIISGKELQKAACCNLSESFSTNASVDIAFTDAVSGAKKIQMLGLDGVYTQVLFENLPMLRGLASSYGLSYVPGTWIENILVTKGTGSVVNGYESISGQINLEFLKPQEQKDRLFLNLYLNHKGRAEANLHLATRLSQKWSSMLFAHASDAGIRQDMNKDSFLDMPMIRQYNVFNRWDFNNQKNMEAQFGVKALVESRQGGQVNFSRDQDADSSLFYGIGIDTKQLEYFTKTGFLFPSRANRSIGIQTSGRWQQQDMFFGRRSYSGEEISFYLNAIFADYIVTTDLKYKAGLSFLYDDFDEKFQDTSFARTETVPGIFGELTYTTGEKFSAVAGVRADAHSIAGNQVSPRLHLRYNPWKQSTFRLSAGRGFRTPNVIVENQGIFASSRTVVFQEQLKPEIAWNYGISFNQSFKLFGNEAFVNLDFFRTDFVNQVIVDLDQHVNQVVFYNLNGESRSHSLQVDFGFTPIKSLDLKAAYKWYDVKSTYNYEFMDKPFVPKHRVMFNAAYATYMDIWKFDATINWLGQTRLPSTVLSPAEYQLPQYSDSYYTVNAQITKRFKKFSMYLGGENILNYMQKNPVIAADKPFGPNFDASMVYAPIEGAIIYTGIRFSIK